MRKDKSIIMYLLLMVSLPGHTIVCTDPVWETGVSLTGEAEPIELDSEKIFRVSLKDGSTPVAINQLSIGVTGIGENGTLYALGGQCTSEGEGYLCNVRPLVVPIVSVSAVRVRLQEEQPYSENLKFWIQPSIGSQEAYPLDITSIPVDKVTASWDLDSQYEMDPGYYIMDGTTELRESLNPGLIPGPVGASGTLAGVSSTSGLIFGSFSMSSGGSEWIPATLHNKLNVQADTPVNIRGRIYKDDNETVSSVLNATLNCP